MKFKVVIFILGLSIITSSEDQSLNKENYHFLESENNFQDTNLIKLTKNPFEDIVNVKCFWIIGLNLYDLSKLKNTNKEYNF